MVDTVFGVTGCQWVTRSGRPLPGPTDAGPAPRARDDDHAWAVRAAVPRDEVSELLLQRQEVRHGAADVGVFDVGGIFRRRRTPNDYKACTRRRPPRAPRPRRPEPAGRCHRQGSDRGPRLAIKAAPVGYGAIFQHIGCRRTILLLVAHYIDYQISILPQQRPDVRSDVH